MDIDSAIARIADIIANNAQNEIGMYSPENVERILSKLNSIDWEQFIVRQRIAERERREKWRENIIVCPDCRQSEKRGVILDYGMCNACQQRIWDAQAKPCIICGVMYVPKVATNVYNVCYAPLCEKVKDQIWSQVGRARKANLPATLTLPEWVQTLNYFEWKCAYCQGAFDGMEHYLPISLKGGTTIDNCVPSCYSCNSKKKDRHPDTFNGLFSAENLTRVREYLALGHKRIETTAKYDLREIRVGATDGLF